MNAKRSQESQTMVTSDLYPSQAVRRGVKGSANDPFGPKGTDISMGRKSSAITPKAFNEKYSRFSTYGSTIMMLGTLGLNKRARSWSKQTTAQLSTLPPVLIVKETVRENSHSPFHSAHSKLQHKLRTPQEQSRHRTMRDASIAIGSLALVFALLSPNEARTLTGDGLNAVSGALQTGASAIMVHNGNRPVTDTNGNTTPPSQATAKSPVSLKLAAGSVICQGAVETVTVKPAENPLSAMERTVHDPNFNYTAVAKPNVFLQDIANINGGHLGTSFVVPTQCVNVPIG